MVLNTDCCRYPSLLSVLCTGVVLNMGDSLNFKYGGSNWWGLLFTMPPFLMDTSVCAGSRLSSLSLALPSSCSSPLRTRINYSKSRSYIQVRENSIEGRPIPESYSWGGLQPRVIFRFLRYMENCDTVTTFLHRYHASRRIPILNN